MDKNRTFLEEAINNVFNEGIASAKTKSLAKEAAEDTHNFLKDKLADIVKEKGLNSVAANNLRVEAYKALKEMC